MMQTITVESLAKRTPEDGPIVVLTFGECSHEDLTGRMLAARAAVDHGSMQGGRLTEVDWPKINAAIRALQDLQLWIDDKSNPDVNKVVGKVQGEVGEPVTAFRLA